MRLTVFQGKNRRIEESALLGEFEFSGFKKASVGEVSIEVNFFINPDGIVEVTAQDPETGVSQSTKVKLSASMGDERIQKMIEMDQLIGEIKGGRSTPVFSSN